VSEGIDLDCAAMQKPFATSCWRRRGQVAAVYYAGHGVQIDGRNYLVPVDLQFQAGTKMTDAMIDMDTIMAGLDDQVRAEVVATTKSNQVPWSNSSLLGEVYLAEK
jgi:uncharacterized caspase-like protein